MFYPSDKLVRQLEVLLASSPTLLAVNPRCRPHPFARTIPLKTFMSGVPMPKLAAFSISVVATLLLAAISYAGGSATSSKWRIEMSGKALTSGEIVFRVTPRQGEAVDVNVDIPNGRAENKVAHDVRDALAAKLSPDRYTVEVDDGEDILIKKKDGQPDFALELLDSNVQNVSIKVEGE